MRFSRCLLSVFLTTGAALCLPGQAVFGDDPATDWTQWRGAGRDSRVQGQWPDSLSAEKLTTVWRQDFGPSYSGPIISGDSVFVTETRDKQDEVVTALSVKTGEEKWTAEWKGAMTVPFFAKANGSWIRSTPATDGERLFVAGIRGRMVCLDAKTGKEVWAVDFSERYGTRPEDFGHVCSPLIIDADESKDKAIYVQCSAGFLKLNRLTGAEIWRTLESGNSMMSRGAFSSPVAATVAGKSQILVQTRTELTGIDPESGDVLWRQEVPNFRGMNILTPTTYGDLVFTSSYNHRSFGFDIAKKDQGFSVSERWTAPSKAYMSSPVVIGKHAYVHLQSKRVACLNLETGDTPWISKKRFGAYWSMVASDDKILALDSRGILFLLKANPKELEILGEVKLKTNDSWAHLAVVGDKIFVRGLNSMTMYEWKP